MSQLCKTGMFYNLGAGKEEDRCAHPLQQLEHHRACILAAGYRDKDKRDDLCALNPFTLRVGCFGSCVSLLA